MAKFGVLYLDDSQTQLDAFRNSLDGSEYALSTALNLPDALRVMRHSPADLVVIDYHMGDVTGDQCLAALRKIAGEHTRFFLYTSDTRAFRRHREMGFDGVLMLKGNASVRTQIDAIARSLRRAREG